MNVKKLLTLLVVVSFIVIGVFPLNAMREDEDRYMLEEMYKRISFDGMENMIENLNEYYILDVRTLAEYTLEHYKGATLHPVEKIDELDLPKDTAIFLYCRSGNRSQEAAYYLLEHGYTNVYDVGGIKDYNGQLEY